MGKRKKRSPDTPSSPIKPGSLKSHTWKRFFRGPDPSLLEELYVPALGEAIHYDRCCAYFSSSVLAAAARGFGRLIERLETLGNKAPRPAVRLIVNEELAEEDVRAMMETGDKAKLEAILQRRFKAPKEILQKQRLAMLGWLVKSGLLEVRVGVMRRGEGIVHAKFGMMTDDAGDALVFAGSGNESAQGLLGNYERLEVSTSWSDPDRYQEYRREFDALWKDGHPDVHTLSLPEAIRLKLIRFTPKEPPIKEPTSAMARQKAAMVWRFLVEAPYLSNGGPACDATALVDLWPHQHRVVEETANAWPEGRLLCDEVGMGKTIEAILILRRLMAGRGVKRALILLPAGLLKQWQAEFREKGGLIIPRLEGTNNLCWPDERGKRVPGLKEALEEDVLIMSRETARTENNLPLLLAAKPWDLVILDESHAARRRKQEEGEFNSGTLLLDLLRQMQLRRQARGFMLLSATPMQTHPWEPWDLLSVLGEGGAWLADFSGVRDYYTAIPAVQNGHCHPETARKAAAMIASDMQFPPYPGEKNPLRDAGKIAQRLSFTLPSKRTDTVNWLRHGSPLARRMHRNTKSTLRRYYDMGLLASTPPEREVNDIIFDYDDAKERWVYNRISQYIERRFEELETEKAGKGFVMTVYRRRASSSPLALERSLMRRREGLRRVAGRRAHDFFLATEDEPEALGAEELPDEETTPRISAAFPTDPHIARQELADVEGVLDDLQSLRGIDTKLNRFFDVLRKVQEDGRPLLIFTEYVDTMEYLRDNLVSHYGKSLGCYSGAGGQRWDGVNWHPVTKDAVTKALHARELQVIVCTDAASEGLNLQAAGAIINYDLPWNPSRVEQRIGRIDRIGQKFSHVRIVNLFLKDSVDDKVYRALQLRCGLFRHFVGPMQPVLARARKMLLGQEPLDLHILDSTASQVDHDPLALETYMECEAGADQQLASSITRDDLEDAMSLIKDDFGPKVKKDKEKSRYRISGHGFAKTAYSLRMDVLEQDRAILPLTSLEPRLRDLAESLCQAGERLPLVIGSAQRGSFRCTVACWVGQKDWHPVLSMRDLKKYVENWQGDYPRVDLWLRAEKAAREEAAKQVHRIEERSAQREQMALRSQKEAARIRLQRELGRYLVCLNAGTSDLNAQFHNQMTRDIATAQRLRKCLDKLGGYPEWQPELIHELDLFGQHLSENQRKARLLGREIDAALEDPRWMAIIST